MNMHNTAEPHPYCRKWDEFPDVTSRFMFLQFLVMYIVLRFFAVCLFGNGLPIIVFVGWIGTRYTSCIMKSMFFA